jgi:hypothetical protein
MMLLVDTMKILSMESQGFHRKFKLGIDLQ